MKKAIKTALMALILTGTSYGVYAACGDNVCGYQGDRFVCYAQDADLSVVECSEDNPCSINCG